MIDLPPEPNIPCISSAAPEAARARMILVVNGSAETVSDFLIQARRYPDLQLEADTTDFDGRRVRFSAPLNLPYRSIGGLIFDAQKRSLHMTLTAEPPICEFQF